MKKRVGNEETGGGGRKHMSWGGGAIMKEGAKKCCVQPASYQRHKSKTLIHCVYIPILTL